MTSAQVVETSVKVTTNSPSQDYTRPDDHNLRTYVITVGHVDELHYVSAISYNEEMVETNLSCGNQYAQVIGSDRAYVLKGQYHGRYHDFWPKFTNFKL